MPETQVKSPTGEIITVKHPEGASDEEILAYAKANAPPPVSYGADIVQSMAAAPRKVAEGLIGLPGTMRSLVGAGADILAGKHIPTEEEMFPNLPSMAPPTPQDIQAQTSKVLGPSYQPQTGPGRLAGAATEGVLGAALGPGGALSKLGVGIGSGVGGEVLGHEYQNTPYELPMRLAGGLIGGVGAAGAGRGVEALRNYSAAKSTGEQIGNILGTGPVKPGAVRRIAASAADDKLTLPGALATQQTLGPNEAMLMDLGTQLQGRAEQMALHPGAAQNTLIHAVEGRTGAYGSGAGERVRQTLTTELGPSQNVVHLMDRVDDIVQRHATPAYTQVMERYPVINIPASVTDRPAVAEAMRNANTLARNYGEKLTAGEGETIQPSLRYWDYVKKGLDRRINGMMKTGMDDLSSSEKADLGGLLSAKKSLVDYLDGVTKGEYANARAIAATKPELHDAMDFGRSIFNSKLLPEEVRAHIGDLSLPGQAMAQAGARRELERILDSVRNDGAKARAFLDTNNNLAKISDLFGPQAAKAIENRVAAENTFQAATENILRNSRTVKRQELAKDTATPSPGDIHATLFGAASAPIKTGLAYALEHGMAGTRSGMSDILTAKGAQLGPTVKALLEYNAQRLKNASTPAGLQMKALVRALMTEQLGR